MPEQDVEEAYRVYGSQVLSRCCHILRDGPAAEDALQETFERVLRHPGAYLAADSRLAWLYRVAERICFDQLDRRRVRRAAPLDERGAVTPSFGPRIEDRELVQRFLEHFDDRVRQVALLHFFDEMGQEEIAAATGWSRQTVWKKLTHLRAEVERLRATLFEGRVP